MMPVAGLEPAWSDPPHFECGASANSATPAYNIIILIYEKEFVKFM